MTRLALLGGKPIRSETLPYGRHTVSEDEIAAVVEVLRSDWLTTGPRVSEFEQAFAATVQTSEAVAVSSGTAALHAAVHALDLGPGQQVIVPAMTFAASANCLVFEGAEPVFCDVDPQTLLLDVDRVEALITPQTRAVVAVDYAGQPCDYRRLRALCGKHGFPLLADACHALGAADSEGPVGSLADASCFSLHPVKHITAGEGGVITTNEPELARRMRTFRNHGITSDHHQRRREQSWFYEMTELGYNYRITDFQCALALGQLGKLPGWIKRRRQIASRYDHAFADQPGICPLAKRSDVLHAYHLYVVRLERTQFTCDRDQIFRALRAEGIGVNVHYIPVHLHPFYRERFGTGPGLCPNAENAYAEILSLPIFPAMTEGDTADVIDALSKVFETYGR